MLHLAESKVFGMAQSLLDRCINSCQDKTVYVCGRKFSASFLSSPLFMIYLFQVHLFRELGFRKKGNSSQ